MKVASIELDLSLLDELSKTHAVVLLDRVLRVLLVLVTREHRHALQSALGVLLGNRAPGGVLEGLAHAGLSVGLWDALDEAQESRSGGAI